MARNKYKFNPQTLTYEVIARPFRLRFYRFLRMFLIGFIAVSVANFVFSFFFYTPKMARIARENSELIGSYDILNRRISAMASRLGEIKHRDNNVYRLLFAADTLQIPGIYTPYPSAKYASLEGDNYSWLMTDTWRRMDDIAKLLYLESRSFDQLQEMSLDKEKLALAVPAIWPIDRTQMRGNLGAFGMRNHPILHKYVMHKGVDMSAARGTPVYATANGVVASPNPDPKGYGRQILIDHGFGYRTRYGHLSKIDVTPGQRVVRGEKIGEVGSTGRSEAPHLHYEVIYMGQVVNPVNYLRRDLSEDDFRQIIENAQTTIYEQFD